VTLATLRAAYADRVGTAARYGSGGLVGYVGADVPVELLRAAGLTPLRLFGDPAGDAAVGERYLGRGLDPVACSVLSRLLEGAYGALDQVVVSRDCEASLRLFYAVRELRRVDPATRLPETYLVDILHLPHATTTAYNSVRIGQFRERIEAWTGRRITDDDLAQAIALYNTQRALLVEAATWRHDRPSRLSGVDFLTVVGAGTAMPVDVHIGHMLKLEPSPAVTARRAYLTGSGHDTPDVYRALAAEGIDVVGEDHDWGELAVRTPVSAPTIEALALRYQYNGPAAPRATIRQRAEHTAEQARRAGAELLVCYARRHDEAPRWDFAAQSEATGLPAIVRDRQPYGRLEARP
jgi:benzoyl-CoA reductase/2-hydroxyglutaryl-CoA dehydratase subunit BcrC/BadD/HgdB